MLGLTTRDLRRLYDGVTGLVTHGRGLGRIDHDSVILSACAICTARDLQALAGKRCGLGYDVRVQGCTLIAGAPCHIFPYAHVHVGHQVIVAEEKGEGGAGPIVLDGDQGTARALGGNPHPG